MRAGSVACLAIWLFCCAPLASAEDAATNLCKAYVADKWDSVGSRSLTSCLETVERTVPEYNAQGFKFGLWGEVLVSADRYYFYRSEDGGKNWRAVGLKTELTKPIETPTPAAESATQPEPDSDAVLSAVQEDAAATPKAAAEAPVTAKAPTAPAQDRRSCSVHTGKAWKLIANLTLQECAAKLDESPDSYDANGFKYAYWSGVFLAANASEVLKSSDSGAWEPLLERKPR